jgi:Skp family chaperone for outer membrane proteins
MKKLFLLMMLLVSSPIQHIFAKEEVSESATWAFISLNAILERSEEWSELMREMEDEFNARKAELKTEEKKLQEAGMAYQKKEQAKLLNDQSREAEVRKLQEMQMRLQQKAQKFEEEGARKQKATFESLVLKIKSVLQRLKKEKNISGFIVDSAWEVDPIVDYTEEIARELNDEYRKTKKAREAKKAVAKPATKK